jgi:hypothetical protein
MQFVEELPGSRHQHTGREGGISLSRADDLLMPIAVIRNFYVSNRIGAPNADMLPKRR